MSSRINILTMPELATNEKLAKIANNYKTYNSIRRDLRKAINIAEYAINVKNALAATQNIPHDIISTIFLINPSLMHAVILYSRWFKDTEDKTTLKPKTYFKTGSPEMIAHESIIYLRDKYIAHNQFDILGGDSIWANFLPDGSFYNIDSDWVEQQFIHLEQVDMSLFRRCLGVVHDKINSVELPGIEKTLNNLLKNSKISSALI